VCPPDDKQTDLVSRKPAPRSIRARDFSMPKPYRKPVVVDARRRASRWRTGLVAVSGLVVAALIAALAMITYENATAPHPLAVVVAPRERQPAPPAAPAASHGRAVARLSPLEPARPEPAPLPAPGVQDTPPPPGAAPSAPGVPVAADPDVDLIASILLLTPRPADSAAPCSPLTDDGCAADGAARP